MISESALAQAKRLIPATHGAVFVKENADSALQATATFSDTADGSKPDAMVFTSAGFILLSFLFLNEASRKL